MMKTLILTSLFFVSLLLLSLPAAPAFAACAGGTVTACGADPSGKTDSTAAFTAAMDATPAGGTLTIPAGTFALASAIVINKPITIICQGTIKPFVNPPGPTPFFLAKAAPFTFDGHNGACVFDGVSAATNNFISAVMVAGADDYIGPAKVTGLHVKNLALNETAAPYEAIAMTAVKNCTISGNTIENSGPNKGYNMGFGIYLQYTQDCTVSGNSGDHLGGAFLNDSGGLRTKFTQNKVSYVTLFGYKAGYGAGINVTASGRPGTTSFTVDDTNYARSALAPGKYINILHAGIYLEGVVDHWTVAPTKFLTIFLTSPMLGPPGIGDGVEPLSTSLRYTNNSCTQTGDNCFDVNGWHDFQSTGTNCHYAGLYQPSGTSFGGLATCMWLGYDPQEPNGSYRGVLARITNTVADHVGGTGIMVTEGVADVVVDNYTLTNIDDLNKGGGAGCGVAMNPFNANPNSSGGDLHIGRGTVTSTAPNSCLAMIEYSKGDSVDGLTGTAANGIMVDAGSQDTVSNTNVTATGTADHTYAYAAGPGGGAHEQGVVFRNNRGKLTAPNWGGGHGYGFISMSPANTGMSVDGSNSVTATGAGFVPRAGF